jgi:predicted nucleic acid-binding protein
MAHLLDTDIVIYHLNSVPDATQLVDRLFDSGVAMNAITFMEVLDGLGRPESPRSASARFTAFAERVPVIPIDREVAAVAALVRRSLREQGRSVRPRALDLLIAATAIAHNLTLVTNNPADCQDISNLQLLPAAIRSQNH